MSLYENEKSGNVLQKPVATHMCGINMKSESILILPYLLFTNWKCSFQIWVHHPFAKSKSDRVRDLYLIWHLYHKRIMKDYSDFDSFSSGRVLEHSTSI